MNLTFSIVLLIAGLVFLALGLLGRIKIKDFEGGSDSIPISVIISLSGLMLLVAAFWVHQSDRLPHVDNSNVAPTSTLIPNTPSPTTATPSPTGTPTLPDPNTLIEIIKRQQRNNVKESYGELAGQNFTQKDLEKFKKQGQVTDTTAQLRADSEFLSLVLAIKCMNVSERNNLMEKALHTYKPTWEEQGEINRNGQTVVGQEAERMIAKAVVDLVRELIQKPDEEIRKSARVPPTKP